MVNRRKFVTATALFPILSACGGGSTTANIVTPENMPPDVVKPVIPGDGIARFTMATNNGFLLDKKPFFMAAGELHPGRIPYQYWDQRIKMVKSMGFNTVSIYDFWSMHEADFDPVKGPKFDFATAENNLPLFLDLCKQNNMWVFLRPGPFVDAYWDLGGIPGYLLKNDGVVLRSSADTNYMAGVARYIAALAPLIAPRLSCNGGPIIMVQVENEYTSYGGDHNYLKAVRTLWQNNGIGVNGNVLLSTNNGINGDTIYNPESALTDIPIGGDPLYFDQAARVYAKYHQPVFGAEIYSGWDSLSSAGAMCGNNGAIYGAKQLAAYIKGLLQEQTSFAIYVASGGTSFEYGAAGNYDDATSFTFDANATSYDYRAPINEQGSKAINLPDASGNVKGSSYDEARAVFVSALSVQDTGYSLKGPLDAVGAAPSTTAIPATPAAYSMITLAPASMPLTAHASIWDNLPAPIVSTTGPLPCERVGMYAGCGIVYQATTPEAVSGVKFLTIERMSDVGTVFLNGLLVGVIDRRPRPGAPFGEVLYSDANLPATSVVKIDFGSTPQFALIEIFVYTFGHTHKEFTGKSGDSFRKGMWGRVYIAPDLSSSSTRITLTNWNIYPLPMATSDISALKPIDSKNQNRPGKFFASTFNVVAVGDAYLDLSTWNLGTVWVNGHNLGRHSASVGPQTRWYCPGAWLNAGSNALLIFDNFITDASSMRVALLDTPNVYQKFDIVSGKTYTITGNHSGLRLGTVQANSVAGALLATAPNGGTEQHWIATDTGGRWQLKNVKSGLLMDVPGGATAEGTPLDIAAANSASSQLFNLLARPDASSFGIKDQRSGLAVTDGVTGTTSRPTIALAVDYANPNQNWTFALA